MSDLVQLTTTDGIAVVTINNPPVNALSSAVASGIAAAVAEIEKDDAVQAVVFIGAGRTFIAGADIKEFGERTSGKIICRESLKPLLMRIEDLHKPVIMALHGTAFGGGLELAMAGHYRVALHDTQVAQPEVKLGIIPGAGGTQRLPRLAGVAKAVEMCAQGAPVAAQDALHSGILDRLVEGDLLTGAISFAKQVAALPAPKTRQRKDKLGTSEQNELFVAARETARKRQRGLLAPLAAIDAIESATRVSFEEGCRIEEELFTKCLFSDQSKALIHVFFGEREVAKIPDVPKDTPTLDIKAVGVIGAGTMGGGIAMVFANAGIPVVLKETDQAALDRGLANIHKNYANSVKRGRFTQQVVDERLKLIHATRTYDEFAGADLAIEAVFEGMALKKEVFRQLDRVCKRSAILATNTSSLDVDEIASATSRRESVIGLHFFSPANVMRLLEIVRGASTGKEVVATCMQLSKKLNKIGVLVGNCPGFVGNRMFGPYRREAQFLVEEGASVADVDNALYEFGMAMGPLATGDLAGLDVGWRIRKENRHLQKPGMRQAFIDDRLCELGRFGQKTRAGWYKYDEHRKRSPDPQVVSLIREWTSEAHIPQRQISSNEIVDRCIYTLINEGARILEEGIALRGVDIDIIYLNGYGFPAYRGGPMWYADTIGLKRVYERIREFEERLGNWWEPAPLLRRLAEQGKTFAEFSGRRGVAA